MICFSYKPYECVIRFSFRKQLLAFLSNENKEVLVTKSLENVSEMKRK
jgi:hypothetical protein